MACDELAIPLGSSHVDHQNQNRPYPRAAIRPEEAAIQAGIKADPDAPELGPEFFARAKPAREVLGDEVLDQLVVAQRGRGRPVGSVAANTKKLVSLRLDPEVVEAARASGAGWQTRVNELLRREFLKP